MNYLLIGNGPSALASKQGGAIDAFPGLVIRFNAYKTKGHEEYVGTRTDVWATVGDVGGCKAYKHAQRWWLNSATSESHEKTRLTLGCEIPEPGWKTHAAATCGTSHPSSGLIVAAWLLSKGHHITLYGFDFMNEMRGHHYADKAQRGPWHDGYMEWLYFSRMLVDGHINYLGWDRERQSIPLVRLPTPCGTEENLSSLRDPGQMGWYKWAADVAGSRGGGSVLDVGAGTCTGLKYLRNRGFQTSGFDTDARLRAYDPDLIVGNDLSVVADGAFDWVTCIDVLEHIPDDLVAFKHMRRIARRGILVTTPNGGRSHCVNSAHCREWTFAQYANTFRPQEVWTGSPDGHLHITRLLSERSGFVIDHGSEGPDNARQAAYYRAFPTGKIPLEVRFTDTVDGQEWPHIAGVHLV
jgi:2-polyprenyl-3-methyl-5-hydroxy-6-metoxy-1,4-benzoquinol methylase